MGVANTMGWGEWEEECRWRGKSQDERVEMKWKQFLPIWLVVFLLAPSIWIHRILMFGARPPGSPEVAKPLFIPFGWLYFGRDLVEQLTRGDFGDALMIFLVLILPILIYTFLASLAVYYCLRKVGSKFGKIN